VPVYNT